ncbi:MAG: F0F1 ATP synthase subunit gamma [bacterium]
MASLRDIRLRIESSTKIKKVTETMMRISSVRAVKFRKLLELSRKYNQALRRYCSDLYYTALQEEKNLNTIALLHGKKEAHTICLIIISANQGMCAGFNTTINQLAEKEYSKYKEAKKSVTIYSIGNKAYQYFKAHNIPVIQSPFDYTDKISIMDVWPFSTEIIESFCRHSIDEIYLIYTKYLSTTHRIPTIELLLPCRHYLESIENKNPKLSLCIPTIKKLLDISIPELISNQIFQSILESSVCENISRRTTMQQASLTARDMVNELTNKYNTVRKNKITLELNEIMATVLALRKH